MPSKRQGYHTEYVKRVREARRTLWILEHGPCQKCGSTETLEIDHVDPSTKACNVETLWMYGEDLRNAELAKCQVLCKACHRAKTTEEIIARMGGPSKCGTYSRYIKGCRCEDCCTANTAYHLERRRRLGIKERVIVEQEPVDGAPHGTRIGYERWKCRCRECRDFNAARSQQRRDRKA